MKITAQNILEVLRQEQEQEGRRCGHEGLTSRQLLHALAQPKSKKSKLRSCLVSMARNKLLHKVKSRYCAIPMAGGSCPMTGRKREAGEGCEATYFHDAHTPYCSMIAGSNRPNQRYRLRKSDYLQLMHGDTLLVRPAKTYARVLRVLKRKYKTLNGAVEQQQGTGNMGDKGLVFVPSHSKITACFAIDSDTTGVIPGGKCTLQITCYPDATGLGRGHLSKTKQAYRSADTFENMRQVIPAEFGVLTEFSAAALAESRNFPAAVRLVPGEQRQDQRDIPFVTIDGKDAQDHDDAVHVERCEEGYRLWVAIADVSAYVAAGGALDHEARMRGFSTYLPGRVYPMLPENLSNTLCSLKPGVNRKTITCSITLDASGQRLCYGLEKALIRSRAALTYQEIDAYFAKTAEGQAKATEEHSGTLRAGRIASTYRQQITLFAELSHILSHKRKQRGCLDFNFCEAELVYDSEGKVVDIRKKFQTQAEKIIESFMLEANDALADYALKHDIPLLWRNHPPPAKASIEAFYALCYRSGVRLGQPMQKEDQGRNLPQMLKQVQQSSSRETLELALLRSMKKAEYGTYNQGHFGLGVEQYCHFTSPIRRYPDLILHQNLSSRIAGEPLLAVDAELAADICECEKRSEQAERAAKKVEALECIAHRIGEHFSVRISGIVPNGCFVSLDRPYIEGFVPASALGAGYYTYDHERHELHSPRNGQKLAVGTPLEVVLVRLDYPRRMPEFAVSGGKKGTKTKSQNTRKAQSTQSKRKEQNKRKARAQAKRETKRSLRLFGEY